MSINPPTKDKEEIINNQDNKTPPQNYEQNITHKIQPPYLHQKPIKTYLNWISTKPYLIGLINPGCIFILLIKFNKTLG